MATTKCEQTFYEKEANVLNPEGCKCQDGTCAWCQVYYGYDGMPQQCACCSEWMNPNQEKIVRIQRGWFGPWEENEGFDRNNENVKFERLICENCFLTDPDLCAFFNKLGMRVR